MKITYKNEKLVAPTVFTAGKVYVVKDGTGPGPYLYTTDRYLVHLESGQVALHQPPDKWVEVQAEVIISNAPTRR